MSNLTIQHLIETDELERMIHHPDTRLRIVDMRGFVKTSMISDIEQKAVYLGCPEEYAAGHIPGATYIDWTKDIVDVNDPVPAQLAPESKLKSVLESAGIGSDSLVVAYDSHPASQFATRFWWVMQWLGHTNVQVLNGGWSKWKREERAISTEFPRFPAASLTEHIQPEWRMTADEVRKIIGSKDALILDARDVDQYTGRIRRGSRGGHIPGAKHLPRELLFNEGGTFRSLPELRNIAQSIGVTPEKRCVAYCNGGVAATSVLFTLSMMGYNNLSNYDGSWNEWSERTDLPVE